MQLFKYSVVLALFIGIASAVALPSELSPADALSDPADAPGDPADALDDPADAPDDPTDSFATDSSARCAKRGQRCNLFTHCCGFTLSCNLLGVSKASLVCKLY